MATPVIQSFTSAIATGTSVAVAYPASIAAGDLLVLFAVSDNPTGTANWTSGGFLPTGFTFVSNRARAGAHLGIWYRIADGSESGSVSIPSTSVNLIGWCLRITGARATTPVNVLGGGYGALASSHAVPGATTPADDCLALVLLAFNGGDAGSFGYSGTGWAKQDEQYSPGTSGSDSSGTWGSKDVGPIGASGTVTITTAVADETVARQIYVRPPDTLNPVRKRRRPRPVDVDPNELRGRIIRRRPHDEDYVAPPPHAPKRHNSRPVSIAPEALQGRIVRQPLLWTPLVVTPRKHRRINQSPPPPSVLGGRTHRRRVQRLAVFQAVMALVADLNITNEAELALIADLDVFAKAQYRVVLRNSATGEETILGTGTNLTGIAIDDGDYTLRVEADGRYWRRARFPTEYAVSIVGGELVVALPPVTALQAQVEGDAINVTWRVDPLSGVTAPTTFGIWVDSTSPVDTSGAPDATVTWAGFVGYFVQLDAEPTTLYVAVGARLGAQIGPVSEVAVTGEAAPGLASPDGVSGRNLDGDWA